MVLEGKNLTEQVSVYNLRAKMKDIFQLQTPRQLAQLENASDSSHLLCLV